MHRFLTQARERETEISNGFLVIQTFKPLPPKNVTLPRAAGRFREGIKPDSEGERVKGEYGGVSITNGHPAGGNMSAIVVAARVHEWRRLKAMPPLAPPAVAAAV